MASLSWSNTRITLLEYCQKKYFFNYYGFALRDMDKDLWLLNLTLRGLKSLEMWMREMTHKLLATYIHAMKKGGEIDVAALKQAIKTEMEIRFKNSSLRDFNQYSKDDNFGLSEHFYKEEAEGKLEETIQKVWANLDAFIASEWHQKMQHWFRTAHHIYIEEPSAPDFDQMKVDIERIPALNGISVMAGPDFGAMIGEHGYVILDWKSGKESMDAGEITDQLKVYALKTLLKQKTTKIDNKEIHAFEVYLPSMNRKGGKVEQIDIDEIITKIIQDVEFQKQFLVDQDPIRNIPVAHAAFQRTSSSKKCANCTFRAVCEKLKSKE